MSSDAFLPRPEPMIIVADVVFPRLLKFPPPGVSNLEGKIMSFNLT